MFNMGNILVLLCADFVCIIFHQFKLGETGIVMSNKYLQKVWIHFIDLTPYFKKRSKWFLIDLKYYEIVSSRNLFYEMWYILSWGYFEQEHNKHLYKIPKIKLLYIYFNLPYCSFNKLIVMIIGYFLYCGIYYVMCSI